MGGSGEDDLEGWRGRRWELVGFLKGEGGEGRRLGKGGGRVEEEGVEEGIVDV